MAEESKESKKSEDKKKTSEQVDPLSSAVRFAGNIDIFPDKPLPAYDTGKNKAYSAVSRGKVSGNLLAIICERHFVPRRNAASVYASIINPGLVPVVAYGKVYWPQAKQERYVIVYKHVLGNRLLQPDQPKAMGLKQDTVMDYT